VSATARCEQMSRWLTTMSVFGALLIVVALGRAGLGLVSGGAAPGTVVDFALLSAPGFVLWYVARWLPNTAFDQSLYPRVLAWSVGGVGVMLAFSLLRVVHPGVNVDGSLGTQAIAVAIGSLGGLAIGIREAEAVTRARELADRNDELAAREQELERQNERLDQFTSIVSHDLRNPLNVAQGRLDLAADDVDSEHLAGVADAHDRMEALVEDLLSLARQGETVDDTEPVDVGALDDGEGFYVADDGPGIPEADRGDVFESGYTTSDDGTGFGLAIVERVSDAHGWTVDVTDAESGGARFAFRGVEVVDRPAATPE